MHKKLVTVGYLRWGGGGEETGRIRNRDERETVPQSPWSIFKGWRGVLCIGKHFEYPVSGTCNPSSSNDCYIFLEFMFPYFFPQYFRFLEEGNIEEAEIQKQRIEQLQRERRRVLEENNVEHQPRFFRCVQGLCGSLLSRYWQYLMLPL